MLNSETSSSSMASLSWLLTLNRDNPLPSDLLGRCGPTEMKYLLATNMTPSWFTDALHHNIKPELQAQPYINFGANQGCSINTVLV